MSETDQTPDQGLLSPTELATYLGVPVQTIYQWRYRGEGPPGYRVGRHVRYRWPDIESWLARQTDDIPRQQPQAGWQYE